MKKMKIMATIMLCASLFMTGCAGGKTEEKPQVGQVVAQAAATPTPAAKPTATAIPKPTATPTPKPTETPIEKPRVVETTTPATKPPKEETQSKTTETPAGEPPAPMAEPPQAVPSTQPAPKPPAPQPQDDPDGVQGYTDIVGDDRQAHDDWVEGWRDHLENTGQ